jgi:hypothetical protein
MRPSPSRSAGLFQSVRQANPDLSESIALVIFHDIAHENAPSDDNPRFTSDYIQNVLPILSSQHYISFQSQMRKVVQAFMYGSPRTWVMLTLK